MKRSPSLTVLVHCPHHGRNVRALKNTAIDRLVACEEQESCRDLQALDTSAAGATARTYPRGCPTYPSLAK